MGIIKPRATKATKQDYYDFENLMDRDRSPNGHRFETWDDGESTGLRARLNLEEYLMVTRHISREEMNRYALLTLIREEGLSEELPDE